MWALSCSQLGVRAPMNFLINIEHIQFFPTPCSDSH